MYLFVNLYPKGFFLLLTQVELAKNGMDEMKALVFSVGIPSLNSPTFNRQDRKIEGQQLHSFFLARNISCIPLRYQVNLHRHNQTESQPALTTVSISYVELFVKLHKQGVREQKLPNPSNIYLSEDEAKLADPYIFLLVTHYADLKKERALPRK